MTGTETRDEGHETVELALDLHMALGEGPIWDAARGLLVFVDIDAGRIHTYDPRTGAEETFDIGVPCGAVACSVSGDWIVAAGRGFLRFDPASRQSRWIAIVEPESRGTRMNDGAVDPQGRFWAGSTSTRREDGQGTLYRLDPDGSVRAMLAPVTTSNGPAWSADGRLMYYVDTRTRRVDVFDFDGDAGTIEGRRTLIDFSEGPGRPDGVITDAGGGIWVALWDGGRVERYTPDGVRDRAIRLPATLTTKAAFAGPRLDVMYVTTASSRLTDEQRAAQPHAGGLFRVRPGVTGRLPNLFGG